MTRTHDEIVQQLVSILENELEIAAPEQKVNADTPLFEGGLGLDSFAIVDLIGRIEGRFGIEFADADLGAEHFSVGTLATLVARRLAPDVAPG
jgi:acyl carrier protein